MAVGDVDARVLLPRLDDSPVTVTELVVPGPG